MGNEVSRAEPSAPWELPDGDGELPEHIQRDIKQLSQSASTFLEANPEFDDTGFNLEDYFDELEAAFKCDENLAQWLPKLVPKRLEEEVFWKNYFSHLTVLRNRGLEELQQSNESAPDLPVPDTVEMPTETEAMENVENIPSPAIVQEPIDIPSAIRRYLAEIEDEASQRRSRKMGSSDNIRWGIVGAGDVCEKKSGPALQKAQGSILQAVQRRTMELAKDFASRHRVSKFYSDVNELIDSSDVDAVYIATPPHLHLDIATLVAEAGKPCLVEKPLARTFEESYALVERFRDEQVPLFVAYYRRTLPRFVLLKKLLDDNQLGEVTSVSYRLCRNDHLNGRDLGWRSVPEKSGGGLFVDLGCHVLDLFDFLFGPLHNISACASRAHSAPTIVETCVSLRCTLGVRTESTLLFNFASAAFEDRLIIDGSAGRLSLSVFGHDDVELTLSDGSKESFEVGHPEHVHEPLVQSIVDELRGVPGRAACPSRPESALRTARAIDIALKSFYGDRTDNFWTRPNSWRF